jgi:glucose/arabinose dehydrogenase
VKDKAFHWFQRYRVTDGYSTYGGRAWLKFTGGQTNYEVVQRELDILDIMTANRDKVIWAAAQGKAIKPDDSNLPKFVPVPTNKPGNGPNGTHLFLSGEEAIQKMNVGKNLKVTLFADEKMFPELANPMQMAFDPQGRLWVAVWPLYPHWRPGEPYNDKLLVLEDTDGDGKADKMTVFYDHLQNPTGFEFYNGGVLVAQAPDLMFLKDTDGDGKADVHERILSGLDTADTHHTSNSFVLDPGGACYFQEGTFHHSQVEDPYGPVTRLANGGVFRYEPRTQKFGVYVTFGFANPHGHVFDKWGQDIVIDGTGAQPYHGPLFSSYLPFPQKHSRPPQVYQQRTRPSGGMEILSSKHFPPEWEGNLAVTNCIGFQGILRYKLSDDGASLKGQEQEIILSSSDPNFRPVDCKVGPDGALYFVD